MSAVLSHPSTSQSDVNARLAFQKQLQVVTNKIHATNNIDEIMLDVSADICTLFNADRLTIYIARRGQAVDRLQGQDRPEFVQGPEAADRRALDRGLRRAGEED